MTGSVNLSSYASSIRCTSDTPTAFYGNASQHGGIYGGIFYGNTSLKTIKNQTLSFQYDDGDIYAREVLEAGKKVIALEDPTKTGYTFAGWDTEIPETMPESDLTVTAKWTANKYDITYVGMDGVDDGQNYPVTHTYDTETVIPNPTKAGYTFSGWKVNGGATPVKDLTLGAADYTADITLTAVWETSRCTVSFDANGGSGSMDAMTVASGESYDLPECGFTAPEGKQFKAWSVGGTEYAVGTSITVTADTTVTAVWEDASTEPSDPEPDPGTSTKLSWKEWLEKLFDKLFGNEEEEECEHEYISEVTEPTCEEQGYTTHTCTKCGDSYKDSYTDALGHTWNEGEVTKEATCTEDGEMTFTCETCGETKTEKIEAPGHTFEDGACTECGAEEPTEPSEPDDSGNSFWDNFWDWLKGWWN